MTSGMKRRVGHKVTDEVTDKEGALADENWWIWELVELSPFLGKNLLSHREEDGLGCPAHHDAGCGISA